MTAKRWYYEVTVQKFDATPLPPDGDDRWELVAVTDAGSTSVAFYWKREKLDE